MKKVIIFGAGNLGGVLATELRNTYEIIGFLDNNSALWGTHIGDFNVLGGVDKINTLDYDEIVIASTMRYDEIKESLVNSGISESKFNKEIQNRLLVEVQARVNFLRDFSKNVSNNDADAAVAEGGVFQGMFAREINHYFPNRRLYLFDTFEGFSKRDVKLEAGRNYSNVKEGYYSETSEDIVMGKMEQPERVHIRKGYFPDTLQGMPEEKYIFVNLDFDLYNPTIEGLRYFYPRMENNGVILIHDYFTAFYHGVKKAIDDYEIEIGKGLVRLPIGDGISIAIVRRGSSTE